MEMRDENNKDLTVLNKHNTLVKGRYNLTSTQNKIYQFILFNTQKVTEIKGNMAVISIDRKEFRKILPPRECETKKLINNFEKIRSKPLQYKRLDSNGKLIWSGYSFFSSYHYYEETQKIEFKIEIDVVKMLNEYVKIGYTPLNMKNISSLNSYYSQRLYELLRLWSNTKTDITYTIDEIKEYMMLDKKKSYSKYGTVKQKVIAPAIEELNHLGIFKIDYEENKLLNGKVDSITFYVEDFENKREIQNEPKKEIKNEFQNVVVEVSEIKNEKSVSESNFVIYIPDETVFSRGVLRRLKSEFKEIDFKNKYMKNAFDDAVMITMDKDDVDIIGSESYSLFKSILSKKIEDYKLIEEQERQHKMEMDMYW